LKASQWCWQWCLNALQPGVWNALRPGIKTAPWPERQDNQQDINILLFIRQVVQVWLLLHSFLMYCPGGLDPSSKSSAEAKTNARLEEGPQYITIKQNTVQFNVKQQVYALD
jgi:hypothetical protein